MQNFFRLLLMILFACTELQAQTLVKVTRYLYKPITVQAEGERLENVLHTVSTNGGFIFSYNASLIRKDSLVTISAVNKPVKDILDQLLNHRFEYRESANYVILRPAFHKISLTLEEIKSTSKQYVVSGYITNEKSGAPLKDASIVEKRLLRSTLTDRNGYFRLRLRGDHKLIMLSVSRENYRDTTVLFLSGINVSSDGYTDSVDQNNSTLSSLVERAGIGKWLVSSRRRIQSLNIPDFLATTPFQASLTPGLSSHGMFSSQVINKVSLNVLGGYTAGVNGVEIAGLFNINKSDVQHIQVAGITNLVGGSVQGIQTGGIMNTVLQQVSGVQVGGILNTVKDSVEGVQVAGIANHARRLNGVQVAGIANISRDDVHGAQIAGIVNRSKTELRGVQIGLINAVKKHHGLQIGLINLADTSGGYSIGLINWVTRGYHKVTMSSNEVTNANLGFKTGNSKLYTLMLAGINASDNAKVYSAGLGLGHDFLFGRRIALSAELSTRYVYLGTFEKVNLVNRFETTLQLRLLKSLSLFAGPSYSLINNSATVSAPGFKPDIVPQKYHRWGNRRGWIGWSAGINVF